MRLAVLVLDGVFDTGLTALLDTFATANELAAAQGFASVPYDVHLVGVRRRIRTALGFSIPVDPASTVHQPDWVVVPAINAKQPERLIEAGFVAVRYKARAVSRCKVLLMLRGHRIDQRQTNGFREHASAVLSRSYA